MNINDYDSPANVTSLQIKYINLKRKLYKNCISRGISKKTVDSLLVEDIIRKSLGKHKDVSNLLIITTLLHMAILKSQYGKSKVSIMLPGLYKLNEGRKSPSAEKLRNDPDVFIPAYLDDKIHCILCSEIAYTSCAYVKNPKIIPDFESRSFIYFVCKKHFLQYPNFENEGNIKDIETVCDAYERGMIMKHQFWNNMDE